MEGIYPISPNGKGRILPKPADKDKLKILTTAHDRKMAILGKTTGYFLVNDNTSAESAEPFYELCSQEAVKKYDKIIISESKAQDVDTDLVRAIMYMETSHGWYDAINPWRKTILPMNVHYIYWKELGYSKEQLEIINTNIKVGTYLLKKIQDHLLDPKISKIASVYNYIGREKVSDYGARVKTIYVSKAWNKC